MRRLLPLLLFAALWFVLAGFGADGWYAGVIGVVGAAALLVALRPVRAGEEDARPDALLHPVGLVTAYLPFVLVQGVRGGIDVARRAFSPSLPLEPEFLDYTIRLPGGPARTLFVNTISLLPGTFSAELDGRALTVHLLARSPDTESQLRELEQRVARAFGLPVPS